MELARASEYLQGSCRLQKRLDLIVAASVQGFHSFFSESSEEVDWFSCLNDCVCIPRSPEGEFLKNRCAQFLGILWHSVARVFITWPCCFWFKFSFEGLCPILVCPPPSPCTSLVSGFSFVVTSNLLKPFSFPVLFTSPFGNTVTTDGLGGRFVAVGGNLSVGRSFRLGIHRDNNMSASTLY